MIGRLGWLTAGVVLGVTGYRRASRLVRSVRPAAGPARQSWAALRPGRPARQAAGRPRSAQVRGIGPFVADVRDGMDSYLDRHSGRRGPTLGGQQVTPGLPGQAGMNGGYPDTDNAKDGR